MKFLSKKQVILGTLLLFVGVYFLYVGNVFSVSEPLIIINNNAPKTTTRDVTLYIESSQDIKEMLIANDVEFTGATWKKYKKINSWTLSVGRGVKVVYLKLKDKSGKVSSIYKDTIELDVPLNIGVTMKINNGEENTKSRNVILNIDSLLGVEEIFISNTSDFTVFDAYTPINKIPWVLSSGSGKKTVYIQSLDANGDTKTISDSIEYTEPPGTLPAGTLFRGYDTSLYYLGFDNKIHPFLHSAVFHSWYGDFADVKIKTVSNFTLRQYSVGKPICIRGGTWLVRFQNFPQLYAVETGCRLFPLRSNLEAYILYGKNWEDRVVTLSNFESGSYSTYYRGVADSKKEIKDADHDGLDFETEKLYKTSDKLPDTDGDGISDIEEVFAWFTDPTTIDTDKDGISDMQYVIDTYIEPADESDLSDVYMYPSELIIQDRSNGNFYMSYIDHLIYFLSKKTNDAAFTTNRLQERFFVPSSLFIPVKPRQGWFVKTNSSNLPHPSIIDTYGNLQSL